MRRFSDLLREARDQAMLAVSEGASDRPTSLYQAGAVGGNERKRPTPPVDDMSTMDVGEVRHHGRDAAIDVVPGRRVRPNVVAQRRAIATGSLRSMLASPTSLRTAMVISEVLGPPVSLRDRRRR